MPDTILTNADLVLADQTLSSRLVLRDRRIANIFNGPTAATGAVDSGGDHLAAGLIELHTDNLERHIKPRPGVDWPHPAVIVAHDAELAGVGITTLFDALRVGSETGAPPGRRG